MKNIQNNLKNKVYDNIHHNLSFFINYVAVVPERILCWAQYTINDPVWYESHTKWITMGDL